MEGGNSHKLVSPQVVRIGYLGALLFNNPLKRRMSSLSLMQKNRGGRQLTRDPFHDPPIPVQIELIVNRRESILEFLYRFSFVYESLLLERKHDPWGFLQAKVFRLARQPAERKTESGNGGSRDTKQSETPHLIAAGFIQIMGLRWERVGCPENGIDVQSDLVLEHVRIENDFRVDLETFPNHPSKGNSGEAVTCTVLHGSAANVLM